MKKLEVINKAMQYGFYNKETNKFYEPSKYEIKYTVDEDGLKYARLEVYEEIMDSSIYHKLILVADVWISNYKKTWWLREDKSE